MEVLERLWLKIRNPMRLLPSENNSKKMVMKIHSEVISQTGGYEGLRDEKLLEWIYAHEKE
ncbi:MAG: hypothetical protein IJA53_02345 [Spirochaetaceae bacterium]|nr:hypothetical protein [Spirochaetaceae bacterium]